MPAPRTSLAALLLSLVPLLACKPYKPTTTSDEFRNSGMGTTIGGVKQLAEEIAPIEFECPQDQMTFQRLVKTNDRVRVTGCGKVATYVHTATSIWVLNTDIEAVKQ